VVPRVAQHRVDIKALHCMMGEIKRNEQETMPL
jgi:hypothetical protein